MPSSSSPAHQTVPRPTTWRDVPQRTIDILVSSAALVSLAPLMGLIAVAILLGSGPPILFSQVRVGRHARPFLMYKFRKLKKDCDPSGCPLTFENDTRLTRVGAFLRSTKLDELPQFWNVLKGDMSVVGPRPETLAFANCFQGDCEAILAYKPGIFGPSQVVFRNESALFPKDGDVIEFYRAVLFPAKARLDLEYYKRRTVFSDIGWTGRGLLAVFGLHRGKLQSSASTPLGGSTL